MNRESGKGSGSAGQLGDQRAVALVTSPSTRPVAWQGLMCTRALTVPGHLRSSTGWVGEHRRPQHLFSSQAICSVSPVLPVGPRRTHSQCVHPPTGEHGQSGGKMVDEAQQTHMRSFSLFPLVFLDTSDSQPGVGLHVTGYLCGCQAVQRKT